MNDPNAGLFFLYYSQKLGFIIDSVTSLDKYHHTTIIAQYKSREYLNLFITSCSKHWLKIKEGSGNNPFFLLVKNYYHFYSHHTI